MKNLQNTKLEQAHEVETGAEEFGCEVIQVTQAYLAKKYATKGITLKPMSNDEFAAEYADVLNASERRLIADLSEFWDKEVN